MAINIKPENRGKFTAQWKKYGPGGVVDPYENAIGANYLAPIPRMMMTSVYPNLGDQPTLSGPVPFDSGISESMTRMINPGDTLNPGVTSGKVGQASGGIGAGGMAAVQGGLDVINSFNQPKGIQRNQSLGKGLGSTAGSIIGNAIAPGIGGMIGSALGGMAGGLIGKGLTKKNSNATENVNTGYAGLNYGTAILETGGILAPNPVTIEVEGGEDAYRRVGNKWQRVREFRGPSHEEGGIVTTMKEGDVIVSKKNREKVREAVKSNDQIALNSIFLSQEKARKRKEEAQLKEMLTATKQKYKKGGMVYESDNYLQYEVQNANQNMAKPNYSYIQGKYGDGGMATVTKVGPYDNTLDRAAIVPIVYPINPETGNPMMESHVPGLVRPGKQLPSYGGGRNIYDRNTGDVTGYYNSLPLSIGYTNKSPEMTANIGMDYRNYGASSPNNGLVGSDYSKDYVRRYGKSTDTSRLTRQSLKSGGYVQYGNGTGGDGISPYRLRENPYASYNSIPGYGVGAVNNPNALFNNRFSTNLTGVSNNPVYSPEVIDMLTHNSPINYGALGYTPSPTPTPAPVSKSIENTSSNTVTRPVLNTSMANEQGTGLTKETGLDTRSPNSNATTGSMNWGNTAMGIVPYISDIAAFAVGASKRDKPGAIRNEQFQNALNSINAMPTDYNIEPQLTEARRQMNTYRRNVNNAMGSSAGVRNARMLAGNQNYNKTYSDLYGTKVNAENQMRANKQQMLGNFYTTMGEAQAGRDYQTRIDNMQTDANARYQMLASLASASNKYQMQGRDNKQMLMDKYRINMMGNALPIMRYYQDNPFMNPDAYTAMFGQSWVK